MSEIINLTTMIIWATYACLLFVTAITYMYKALLWIYATVHHKEGTKYPDAKVNHRYAILMPARNESAVIENLFKCLKAQKYDLSFLYFLVGVESLDDPTCEIAKRYGFDVYLKKNLDKKGKGVIVNEMINYINNESGFDAEAFMIFDADNLVDENFVFEMNKAFDAGNLAGVGYRNSKNWDSNWISACSGLTFTRFSTLENLGRTRFGSTVQIAGTGFYISRALLDKMGGWQFYTLTEDLELTLRLAVDNVKTCYVSSAIIYDEQPTKWKDSKAQRTRWIKGYMQANKIYGRKLKKGMCSKKSNRLGCYDFGFQALPMGLFVGTCICVTFASLINILFGLAVAAYTSALITFAALCGFYLMIYLGIVMDTAISFELEREQIKIPIKIYLQSLFMNPIFIGAYMWLAIKVIFSRKEVEWVPIEHNINKELDELKQRSDSDFK